MTAWLMLVVSVNRTGQLVALGWRTTACDRRGDKEVFNISAEEPRGG